MSKLRNVDEHLNLMPTIKLTQYLTDTYNYYIKHSGSASKANVGG